MQDKFYETLLSFYKKVLLGTAEVFEPYIESVGLTPFQFRVLTALKRNEKLSVGELCSKIGMNKGNCSTLCKKLEKSGMITRTRSHDDERRVELSLSECGNEMFVGIDSFSEQLYSSMCEKWSAEERKQLSGAIEKIELMFDGLCASAKAVCAEKISVPVEETEI